MPGRAKKTIIKEVIMIDTTKKKPYFYSNFEVIKQK
jgi:hypothetical protein